MGDDDKLIRLDTWNARDRRINVLGRRHRIRRSLELEWREETGSPRRYPHKLERVLPGHEVAFRRGNWRKLDEWPEEGQDPVRIRDTFAWIEFNGERVGAVGFTEIDAWGSTPAEFWQQLDDESSTLARLAGMLLSAWPELTWDVCQYGWLMEVGVVWVHPRHPHQAIWKPVLRELIRRVQKNCSVFIAHCFPLEYQWLLGSGSRLRIGFDRRQAALMRVCEREFGMRPLPGPPGDQGFMWAPRPDIARHIDEPTFTTDWIDEL